MMNPTNKRGPLQGLQQAAPFSSPFLPNVSAGAQAGEGFDPFMGTPWGRYLDTLSGKEAGGPPMNVAIQGLQSLPTSPGIHKITQPTTPKAPKTQSMPQADWYGQRAAPTPTSVDQLKAPIDRADWYNQGRKKL